MERQAYLSESAGDSSTAEELYHEALAEFVKTLSSTHKHINAIAYQFAILMLTAIAWMKPIECLTGCLKSTLAAEALTTRILRNIFFTF